MESTHASCELHLASLIAVVNVFFKGLGFPYLLKDVM